MLVDGIDAGGDAFDRVVDDDLIGRAKESHGEDHRRDDDDDAFRHRARAWPRRIEPTRLAASRRADAGTR